MGGDEIQDLEPVLDIADRVHVVAVSRDTLVEAPGDVFRDLARWFPAGLPSAFAFSSGPSKSADIDGEVVYGVHGPLAAIAVLV